MATTYCDNPDCQREMKEPIVEIETRHPDMLSSIKYGNTVVKIEEEDFCSIPCFFNTLMGRLNPKKKRKN